MYAIPWAYQHLGEKNDHIIANLEKLRNIHTGAHKIIWVNRIRIQPNFWENVLWGRISVISLHCWGEIRHGFGPAWSFAQNSAISFTNSLQQTNCIIRFPTPKNGLLETSMTCVLIVKNIINAKKQTTNSSETIADYDGLLPNCTTLVFPLQNAPPTAPRPKRLFRLRSLKNGGNFGVPELHLLRSSKVTLERKPCGCNGVVVSKKITKMVWSNPKYNGCPRKLVKRVSKWVIPPIYHYTPFIRGYNPDTTSYLSCGFPTSYWTELHEWCGWGGACQRIPKKALSPFKQKGRTSRGAGILWDFQVGAWWACAIHSNTNRGSNYLRKMLKKKWHQCRQDFRNFRRCLCVGSQDWKGWHPSTRWESAT